jgi:hypothetical protein
MLKLYILIVQLVEILVFSILASSTLDVNYAIVSLLKFEIAA